MPSYPVETRFTDQIDSQSKTASSEVRVILLKQDRVVGCCFGHGIGAVGPPALRMLTMRAVGRGGDGVAHTPALAIHNRVVVPQQILS